MTLHYAVPGSGSIVCGAKVERVNIARYADDVTCPACLSSPRLHKIIGACGGCGVPHVRECCTCDGSLHTPGCSTALAQGHPAQGISNLPQFPQPVEEAAVMPRPISVHSRKSIGLTSCP